VRPNPRPPPPPRLVLPPWLHPNHPLADRLG
jgi:hypothetical protein